MTETILEHMKTLNLPTRDHYTTKDIYTDTNFLIEEATAKNDSSSKALINARNYLWKNLDELNRVAKMTSEELESK